MLRTSFRSYGKVVQCDALWLLYTGIPRPIQHEPPGTAGPPPGGMFGFVDKELDAFKEFLGVKKSRPTVNDNLPVMAQNTNCNE